MLTVVYRALHYLALGSQGPHLLFSSHSSLLSVLQQTVHASTCGPLCLVDMAHSLTSVQASTQIHVLERGLLWLLCLKKCPLLSSPSLCFMFLFQYTSPEKTYLCYIVLLLSTNPTKFLEGRDFVLFTKSYAPTGKAST